jgi:acyl dehydratase
VGTVRKVGVGYAALVRLGDVITCRGKVVARRPPKEGYGPVLVDLEQWAENQKGEKVVTGKATAALVSRG